MSYPNLTPAQVFIVETLKNDPEYSGVPCDDALHFMYRVELVEKAIHNFEMAIKDVARRGYVFPEIPHYTERDYIFLGGGAHSEAQCAQVHSDLDEAFSMLSGLQQGGEPNESCSKNTIADLLTNICGAFGFEATLKPGKK